MFISVVITFKSVFQHLLNVFWKYFWSLPVIFTITCQTLGDFSILLIASLFLFLKPMAAVFNQTFTIKFVFAAFPWLHRLNQLANLFFSLWVVVDYDGNYMLGEVLARSRYSTGLIFCEKITFSFGPLVYLFWRSRSSWE